MTRCMLLVSLALIFSSTTPAAAAPPPRDLRHDVIARDPGPREGAPGAGGPLAWLSADQRASFTAARARFTEIDSVSGGVAGEDGRGLGPSFNANSCAACHAEPAAGGSSSHPVFGFVKVPNPQVALAKLDRLPGMAQAVPPFITIDGPVREVRFVKKPDGTVDGGVHGLYTIAGRIDAPDCRLPQPDFAAEMARNNVIFRIPTPMFGLGLVEKTTDAELRNNLAATTSVRQAAGIGGRFNTTGNDGTITRFGWKAQNKSLLLFAGEAYNVEQGVSNEIFPNERDVSPGCNLNPTPEDATNLYTPDGALAGSASAMSSDMVNFALFARLSAPPSPTTSTRSELNGQRLFAAVGCVLCHSPTLRSTVGEYHPYSDFAIHHMGQGLADNVSQGAAGGDEFRTAPLWGVGQRIFFLHDGRAGPRTGGLVSAIVAHRSDGSEASGVVRNYQQLSPSDQQDLLHFLRSL